VVLERAREPAEASERQTPGLGRDGAPQPAEDRGGPHERGVPAPSVGDQCRRAVEGDVSTEGTAERGEEVACGAKKVIRVMRWRDAVPVNDFETRF
jgi:hypothetical protein